MKAIFSFFKAGQGSFYGGRICQCDIEQVFTVVYDCGTNPFIAGNSQSLNNEITHFKSQDKNIEIDLLFISHLDYDHVSGLKRLLKEFKVKNIILPYISKVHRQFFLTSIPDNNDPDNNDPDNNLSFEDYILFIESPNQFISQNSDSTKMYFVKSNDKNEIEYQGYDKENQSEYTYPRGTINREEDELTGQKKVFKYDNNLQFFIKQYWEFTTYSKSVSQVAIDKLHLCLREKFNKKLNNNLTLDDLIRIVTTNRKEAHKCYTKYIGDINSHGLVLLHGPIDFDHLHSGIYSDCELNKFNNYRRYYRHYCNEDVFYKNNRSMLGTLLFGDTSLKGVNKINFPQAFKDKLVNVHVVQVPHHGSSKNWDFKEFNTFKIGDNVNRWEHRVVAVCNFGFGNKFGHPSHEVLDDLSSTIFLNSQFSRLNISYDYIFY